MTPLLSARPHTQSLLRVQPQPPPCPLLSQFPGPWAHNSLQCPCLEGDHPQSLDGCVTTVRPDSPTPRGTLLIPQRSQNSDLLP